MSTLMKNVELSLRLKEKGLLCYISKGVMVSARRWANFRLRFFQELYTVIVSQKLSGMMSEMKR
jgi:hypothetical protein